MNQHLIGSRSAYVREYVVNGLVEQQMVILAAIIRDLDHEAARTETGTFKFLQFVLSNSVIAFEITNLLIFHNLQALFQFFTVPH